MEANAKGFGRAIWNTAVYIYVKESLKETRRNVPTYILKTPLTTVYTDW